MSSFLRDRLTESDSLGTARYLLDCFSSEQLTAIALSILDDRILSRQIEIKLPKHFVVGDRLPPELLTTERTTYFRNCACEKPALLVANTGDDEEQSLKELVPIGSAQLQAEPGLWVEIAANGLPITDDHRKWWKQALVGLLDSRAVSLVRFADYVAETRRAILDEGHPIINALGYALPALHAPRDTTYFTSLSEKTAGHASKWRNLFSAAFKKRACYLVKQTPSQGLLTEEDLSTAFEKVADSIPADSHDAIRRFIHSPSGWTQEAGDIAKYEWELIKPLFDGLKREQFNLGKATAEFYEERDPGLLTDMERDYLNRLAQRKALDPDDEDEDFYRNHRHELKEKPSLKARWDYFIFGSPAETQDFAVGLTDCLQALFDQDQQSTKRKLTVTSDRRTPKDLKELNCDAGLYFAMRYRGIKELIGRGCAWEVGRLFDFPDLDKQWRAASKPYVNRSTAKAALQLKFYLELEVTLSGGQIEVYSKQLLWKFSPSAISAELYSDWSRLVEHPMMPCRTTREVVSSKGRCQSVDLRDVRTLLPTFDKDRGSLVPTYKKDSDLEYSWPQNLKQCLGQHLVTQPVYEKILGLFEQFTAAYKAAIAGFWNEGLTCTSLVQQVRLYGSLLETICSEAKGDRNRALLLRPLMELGVAQVDGGPVTAIVAPWHPLRLAGLAVKAQYVAGLLRHLLTAENVYFGDTRLYFTELAEELQHPFYPEVILGWYENRAELLSLNDQHLDYSLHESPIAARENHCDTNENPSDSAAHITDLIERFLLLHPHEQANLSIVLYNCDSARLPQAIVNRLNEIHEDQEDMRCQVILRHRNGAKLRDLYEKIIESSDVDADSFIASEASRDFMARLRIGIMADQAPPPDSADGPPTDIVFLQDVIARHARLEWYLESAEPVSFESWIPPRWSRRRPAAIDDMK